MQYTEPETMEEKAAAYDRALSVLNPHAESRVRWIRSHHGSMLEASVAMLNTAMTLIARINTDDLLGALRGAQEPNSEPNGEISVTITFDIQHNEGRAEFVIIESENYRAILQYKEARWLMHLPASGRDATYEEYIEIMKSDVPPPSLQNEHATFFLLCAPVDVVTRSR